MRTFANGHAEDRHLAIKDHHVRVRREARAERLKDAAKPRRSPSPRCAEDAAISPAVEPHYPRGHRRRDRHRRSGLSGQPEPCQGALPEVGNDTSFDHFRAPPFQESLVDVKALLERLLTEDFRDRPPRLQSGSAAHSSLGDSLSSSHSTAALEDSRQEDSTLLNLLSRELNCTNSFNVDACAARLLSRELDNTVDVPPQVGQSSRSTVSPTASSTSPGSPQRQRHWVQQAQASAELRECQATAATIEEKVLSARRSRLHAHLHLHMQAPGFDVVPMLIGQKGERTKRISEKTKAKVRVRGRGSGHIEYNGQEASAPLMVAISADAENVVGFREAIRMVWAELKRLEVRYRKFCRVAKCCLQESCFSLGKVADNAEAVASDIFQQLRPVGADISKR